MKNNIPFFEFINCYRRVMVLGYTLLLSLCIIATIASGFYMSGFIVCGIFHLIFTLAIIWDWKDFQRKVGKKQLPPQHYKYALQD